MDDYVIRKPVNKKIKLVQDTDDESCSDTQSSTELDPNYVNSGYECKRPHPLNHKNSKLVELFDLIKQDRLYNGEKFSALAYQKTISALKSYPKDISSSREAAKIRGIGKKMVLLIDEYLKTSTIKEAENLKFSQKFHTLKLFNSVYGCGDKTARIWYSKGYQTVQDVLEKEKHLTKNLLLGLELFSNFSQLMSRADVEEIFDNVRQVAALVLPSATLTLVGGYCRGKELNGDVDIIVCNGQLEILVAALQKTGFVKHLLVQDSAKTTVAFMQKSTLIQRQVDFIATSFENYVTNLICYSGSTQYQRSLRSWCKFGIKDYHFGLDGLFQVSTGKKIVVQSESEFFAILKLPFLNSSLRNP